MKPNIFVFLIPVILLFYGCGHSAADSHGHDHEHGHDHSHHGHDHSHDGHDHSHSAHDNSHGEEGEHDEDEIIFSKEQADAAGVEVESVSPSDFREVIKAGGQILAAQGDEAGIVSTANGIVSFGVSSLAEGSYIRKGETVVIISAQNLPDGDPVVKAKIAYETAGKERARAESLLKDKLMSAKDYEQVLLRYETARTVYEAQAGNVTGSGIKVTSPINGYIKNRKIGQGEYVSVGQEIATVSQNRRLQLRADVPGNYFKSLRLLESANFKSGYDDGVYRLGDLNGKMVSFGKTSDANSFYIPVIFEFDNSVDVIPGSYVEAYLLSSLRREVITVPIGALTEEQGLHFVYLKLDEEGYRKQEVTVGQDDGDRIEIVSGLSAGDVVVTKGVYQIKLASVSSVIPEGHTH
jgi:RND family efflux transporter MFP subunit